MKVVRIGTGYFEEVPAPDGYGYRRLNREEVEKLMERKICTKESPMPPDDKGYWAHPDSTYKYQIDEGLTGGGSYEVRHCPNCNLTFRITLPD